MPYSEKGLIRAPLKPSPTALYNNLTLADGNLIYAHNRSACVLSPATVGQGVPVPLHRVDAQSVDAIHAVQACTISDSMIFVVLGTEGGIQVWDKTCSTLLHVWTFPEQERQGGQPGIALYAQGIAVVQAADGSNCICFGSSRGNLHVMRVTSDGRFDAPAVFANHASPITALGSAHKTRRGPGATEHVNKLISCDQEGLVTVWTANFATDFKAEGSISSCKVPASSAAVKHDNLVLARLDGTMQVFSLASLQLKLEVAAHSRWITAMDVHPSKDLFATVAEDATVSVWTLPTASEPKVKNVLSANWMHAMPTGVSFCGHGSDDVAVVALDTEELRIYKYK